MIPVDTKVSVIDLKETGDAFQIHQGTTSSDADGDRQATVLFPKGVTAQMQMPDGSAQNIGVLNVRATEYTIGANGPNAMPGELPPATGYTYAVELSVDQAMEAGATRVDFDKTLTVYVDNFLEFPVGVIVPSGWYNLEQAAWVPDGNGRIVQILDIENNLAILDITGTGNAATAEELEVEGITAEERAEIAKLYQPGKTLWRVGANHFTAYDYNWPYGPEPCEPGEECESPGKEGPDHNPDPDPCNKKRGCEIQVSSRTMSESVSVTGTPFTLNYNTSRASGFLEKASFSESYLRGDGNLKKSLISIEAEVQLLGRTIATFSDVPSNVSEWQIDKFVWDGKDRYGRKVQNNAVSAKHNVIYNIPAVYYGSHTAEIKSVFAQYSSSASFAMPRNKDARTYVPVVKTKKRKLRSPNHNEPAPWSLNEMHKYDAVRQELYLGNGMKINRNNFTHKQLTTLTKGWASYYADVTVLPDGSAQFIYSGFGIYSGIYSWDTEAGSVARLDINTSESLVWKLIRYDHRNSNGKTYLVDSSNRIFYRESNGDLVLVAGKRYDSSGWNNGPEAFPSEVTFSNITDIHLGFDHVLYIADAGRSCIQKLDTDNMIRTVAGRCGQRWSATQPFEIPAGTLASQILLNYPAGVAQDSIGNLYISDQWRYQIFKINIDGTIEPYVGIGNPAIVSDTDSCQDLFLSESPLSSCLFPDKLAVSGDALYFIADAKSSWVTPVLFKINERGGKEVVAGDLSSLMPESMAAGNDPFNALARKINWGFLASGGDDSIYLFDQSRMNVLTFKPSPLPGFDGRDVLVAEDDGKRAYRFNSAGRHLETIDTLTGAKIYQFGYDGAGLLSSITDFDGRKTTITRGSGSSVITSADGHQTKLTYDSKGLLTEISNPNNEAWKFEYDDGGLMLKTTNPRGQSNRFTYDESSRLLTDAWPNGGGWTLWDTFEEEGYYPWDRKIKKTTTLISGEGQIYNYTKYEPPFSQSNTSKTTANPDGSISQSSINIYGYPATATTRGDQRNSATSSIAGDPRFGLMAPYTSSSSSNTGNWEADDGHWDGGRWRQIPNGYTTTRRTRFTEVNDDGTLFPVKKWGEERWFNSANPSSEVYDHDEGLWTATSENGRVSKTWVDAVHRPLKAEAPGVPATLYTYNQGKVTQIEVKPAEGASRFWRNEYDARGNLSKAFDPLNRAVTYEYDAVGRVTKQTLPDGRSVQQRYDAMGNLIELTTPAGEKHLFNFDVMGDKERYTPPQISNTDTRYFYNKDRQPIKTVLPGGSEVNWVYDPPSGRLTTTNYSEGFRAMAYDSALRPASISEGGNTLLILYDGVHAGGQSWVGDVNGVFRTYHDPVVINYRSYNKGFVTRTEVTGANPAALRQRFTYGPDDEVTALSLMRPGTFPTGPWLETRKITFARDTDTLRLNQVKGWSNYDKDERTYNTFGELTGYRFHQPRQYGVLIDQAQVTLTGNETPVDFLKVEGALILEGSYAGLDKLWLAAERTGGEAPFTDQWFAIEPEGLITGRTLGLEGAPDVARDLTVSVGKAGLTWNRTVGKITKQARASSPVEQFTAIETGVSPKLYAIERQFGDSDGEYIYPVTRLDPATVQVGQFNAQTQIQEGYSWNANIELIGAYGGQAYLRHIMSWDCGQDENDQPYDCVTAQKEGQAELLFPIPGNQYIDSGWDENNRPYFITENHHLTHIAGTHRQFYVARERNRQYLYTSMPLAKQFKSGEENKFDIERWDSAGNKHPIATIDKASGEWIVSLVSAGNDLLIGLRSHQSHGNIGRTIRVNADGSHQNVPLETESTTNILSLFGDNESTCYTLQKEQDYNDPLPDEYVCKNLNGEETNRSVMPPRDPYSWLTHSPSMNPPTKTVYITLPTVRLDYWNSDYTLWHLKNPASRDNGLWLTAFESEPIKTATLTIGGNLSELDGGYQINVERDLLGRITAKQENLEGQKLKQSYTYDQAGRLIEVKTGENGENVETWGYDNNGNRTHHNGSPIAVFDAQDRILSQNDTTYEHNLMGQRTKKVSPEGVTTYRYDNLGNLRDVTLPDGTQITYVIDSQDRRIGRKVNGNWTHKWIYQDGLNPIAEMDDQDRIRKAFVYADKGHVPSYMLAFDENGNETHQYRIVSDLLGSVRVVYDLADGNPVQQIDYDVWGNVINDTNPGFQPFGFAGGLYDSQTKLVRFGARDYDAETARWTAKDPIGFKGGINLYGYAANDPINLIDIYGLAPGDTFGSVLDAVVDAKKHVATLPRYLDIEYGGWVYKVECGYTYNLQKGTPGWVDTRGIKPADPAASWHTHPMANADSPIMHFSDGDKRNAGIDGVPAYLITYKAIDAIRVYDPRTKQERRVQ
ncbi:MAG: hypothetical protein LBI35_00385 [Burkholderiales bacterium]|jgi:RHS repeat-associated protein|nr:hypothetical protein [Burkholderiales bacterium]